MPSQHQKLNPQAIKILDILDDLQWHCPIEWHYSDGHCKRITDINEHLKLEGLRIESKVCDCGRHTGKVFKRRIIRIEQETTPTMANFTPQSHLNERSPKNLKTFCCLSSWRGEPHDPKCHYLTKKEIKQTQLF